MTEPIIKFATENDYYKWTMGRAFQEAFPPCEVVYDLKVRSDEKLGFLKPELDEQLDHFCNIRYTDDEINFLGLQRCLPQRFVRGFRRFYPFREDINTHVTDDGQLALRIHSSLIEDGTWFEVPTMAIISELYTRYMLTKFTEKEIKEARREEEARLDDFIKRLDKLYEKGPFTFSDFGLRRRESAEWEDYVVSKCKGHSWFAGTSNVYLAMKYGVKPCGTMAHELFMAMQGADVQLRNVQKHVWKVWMDVYKGDNGILLTDPFGARACFRELDYFTANNAKGFRHDSGNPFKWGEELIETLKNLTFSENQIKGKTGVWSDCLTIDKIEEIHEAFNGRIGISFGVGSNLTHMTPLFHFIEMVIKMTWCNGTPVLKIPDSLGKTMCPNASTVEYAKQEYGWDPII